MLHKQDTAKIKLFKMRIVIKDNLKRSLSYFLLQMSQDSLLSLMETMSLNQFC